VVGLNVDDGLRLPNMPPDWASTRSAAPIQITAAATNSDAIQRYDIFISAPLRVRRSR
jgi:hypothetical protein